MKLLIILAATLALLAPAAQAANLTVVKVNAPAVNCVFNTTCKVTVTDDVESFQWTLLGGGAVLQSRTYPAGPGSPAAGNMAYEYRVDLSQGAQFADCLAGLTLNFGPVLTLTYPPNTPGQVFVVTTGGLGSVGIKSAEQDGNAITFTFDKYLCHGQSTYFFGLAAKKTAQTLPASVFLIGPTPYMQTNSRVPQH